MGALDMKIGSEQDSTFEKCRLCDGELSSLFTATVLGKHAVAYFQCRNCGSALTEKPYWLEEAYKNHLTSTDTGAAQRNLHNLAACYFISRLFGLRTAIDIGGSDGLLCRFLRDYGLDCYVQDKYAKPSYAQGFTQPDFAFPDFVSAFEVFEHFVNPKEDLAALFALQPRLMLTTTVVYTGQDKSWWYFAPHGGQHVFFYSRKALQQIAATYGYEVVLSGGFVLFARRELLSKGRRAVASVLLHKIVCRLLRAIVVLLPANGAWKDHRDQEARLIAHFQQQRHV